MKNIIKKFTILISLSLGAIIFLYYLIDIENFKIARKYRILISIISFFIGGTYVLFTSLWINKFIFIFLSSNSRKQINKTFYLYSSLVLTILSFLIVPLTLYFGAKIIILGRISELDYNSQDDFGLLHFSVAFLTLLIFFIIHFIIFIIGINKPIKLKFTRKRNVIISFALGVVFLIVTLYTAVFKSITILTSFFENYISSRFDF